jgi:hypothetical protein
MKVFNITLFAFFLAGLVFMSASDARQKQMSVQVRSGPVRTTPSFLGKIISTLSYGDRVDIVEEKTAWSRIRIPGTATSGWIHATALTPKKIILSAGSVDVDQAATSDELALAGKGFNSQVEGEFRERNRQIDFTWIDKMEQFVVSQAQIRRFIEYGGLKLEGGDK